MNAPRVLNHRALDEWLHSELNYTGHSLNTESAMDGALDL